MQHVFVVLLFFQLFFSSLLVNRWFKNTQLYDFILVAAMVCMGGIIKNAGYSYNEGKLGIRVCALVCLTIYLLPSSK